MLLNTSDKCMQKHYNNGKKKKIMVTTVLTTVGILYECLLCFLYQACRPSLAGQ